MLLLDDVKHTEKHGGRYDKPYFIAWFNHSWLTLCIIPALLMFPQLPGGSACARSDIEGYIRRSGFSPNYFLFLTLGLTVLFQGVNYFWALVLPAEGNDCFVCMSQLVFVVIFVMSAAYGERQSWSRFVSVAVCLVGVSISAWQADLRSLRKTAQNKADLVFVAIHCVAAATFAVCFKRTLGGAERRIAVIWLFIGLMGLFTFMGLWPGLLVVHALGIEKMEAPPSSDWPMIGFICALYLAHNTCCIIGIALTSPLTVGVVKAMAIPVTFLSDFLREVRNPNQMEVIGATLIGMGFLGTVLTKDIIDDVHFGDRGPRVYDVSGGGETHGLLDSSEDSSDDEDLPPRSPVKVICDSDDDLMSEIE